VKADLPVECAGTSPSLRALEAQVVRPSRRRVAANQVPRPLACVQAVKTGEPGVVAALDWFATSRDAIRRRPASTAGELHVSAARGGEGSPRDSLLTAFAVLLAGARGRSTSRSSAST